MKKSFKAVVREIEDAESNVDKVLKAARLKRCPKERISEEFLMFLVVIMFFGLMVSMLFFSGAMN